ncbi:MAG: DUF4293 domain-containing protein [Bacteroidota bacterium]|nr:DUF4293 domain-containing protein [Bacteroidota bacterium]
MIQRIQTLWLLLATLLVGTMFFFPLAEIIDFSNDYIIEISKVGQYPYESVEMVLYIVIGLIAVSVLLIFLNIFLYKRRPIQMRICVYTAILMLGILGAEAYLFLWVFGEFSILPGLAAFSPVLGFILLLMARRAIKLDDLLVKSINRLR